MFPLFQHVLPWLRHPATTTATLQGPYVRSANAANCSVPALLNLKLFSASVAVLSRSCAPNSSSFLSSFTHLPFFFLASLPWNSSETFNGMEECLLSPGSETNMLMCCHQRQCLYQIPLKHALIAARSLSASLFQCRARNWILTPQQHAHLPASSLPVHLPTASTNCTFLLVTSSLICSFCSNFNCRAPILPSICRIDEM